MDHSSESKSSSLSEWAKLAEKESKGKKIEDLTWKSLEGIDVKALYTKEDTDKLAYTNYYDRVIFYIEK